MQTMNISIPEPLKEFVDATIAEGRYSSVSEYVRELIRADERKRAQEQMEDAMMEGLEGEGTIIDDEFWKDVRRRGRERYAARHKEK